MIEINGLIFDIKITKKRMRNMYMRLNGNTIEISAPKYVNDNEIYRFINERKKWIYETYFKAIVNDSTSYKYHHGNIFYIFGDKYEIEFKLGRSKVIIDDNNAKKHAQYLGLPVTGTLGVLMKAKSVGYISELKPLLQKMLDNHIYISQVLIDKCLKRVGE